MPIYLHDIPLSQAQARLQEALEAGRVCGRSWAWRKSRWMKMRWGGCWPSRCGRGFPHRIITPRPWTALPCAPQSTTGALPSRPVTLRMDEEAVYVDTGDPLPDWANAVVPIENVEPLDEAGSPAADPRHPYAIRLRDALPPWAHVRPMGEDIVATELVLPAGHTLRPVDLGAIAASGHATVQVARRPRVAILPTGTELVPIGQPVKRGDIIEYNSLVLAAQVAGVGWGGAALPDHPG